MKKYYVINYDEAVIFEANETVTFLYDKKYETFKEAKEDLVDYWDRLSTTSTLTLKEVKKIKIKDVKTFQ